MFKIRTLLSVMVILATQQAFADIAPAGTSTFTNSAGSMSAPAAGSAASVAATADSSQPASPCSTVVKACASAGYDRSETSNKNIWDNCMKPIMLGQPVANVSVDASVVEACRSQKLKDLKKEAKDIQKAM